MVVADSKLDSSKRFGLYLHVPFCASLCHYCDFAKTANWDNPLVASYFDQMLHDLRLWLEFFKKSNATPHLLSSFFLGGGTPGLFTEEFAPLFTEVRPFLADNAELCLEANPDNVSREKLDYWIDLGLTRISIGVQTFDEVGLAFLKRDHSSCQAFEAVSLASESELSVNLDLIYGWPGQSMDSWQLDLEKAVDLRTDHLSLYNLIYESGTPIGRRQARGALDAVEEDLEVKFYEYACEFLAEHGYIHDEVSNWAKPGHSCSHNWLYWQGEPYIGIGSGAHGFLPEEGVSVEGRRGFAHEEGGIGHRYSYLRNERKYSRHDPAQIRHGSLEPKNGLPLELSRRISSEVRNADDWLTEYVGCGLRCRRGIDLGRIKSTIGASFQPGEKLSDAFARSLLKLDTDVRGNQRLLLDPAEWIRETYWSLRILASFELKGS